MPRVTVHDGAGSAARRPTSAIDLGSFSVRFSIRRVPYALPSRGPRQVSGEFAARFAPIAHFQTAGETSPSL